MPARRRQPEKVEQQHVVGLLRSLGCTVWVTGVRRRAGDYQGTMMTPGLPDVLAFLPRGLGLLFVEVKAARGRMSAEQANFRASALEAQANGGHVYHVTGGLTAVLVQLVALDLVRADSLPHYRTSAEVGDERCEGHGGARQGRDRSRW